MSKIKYRLGIDGNGKVFSYCLCRVLDLRVEIILAKTFKRKKKFKKQVKLLAKLFNAKVHGEI